MKTNSEINESIASVGSDLLDFAMEHGEPTRLPLITQLFPFLILASRRMANHEMSSWLAANKGIKISGTMIAKGLKRPDLHLKRIAEHVQPLAAYLAAVYHDAGESAESLLFGKDPISGETNLKAMFEMIWNAPEPPSEGVSEALQTLTDIWVSMPEEVKFMCRRFFDFGEDANREPSEQ